MVNTLESIRVPIAFPHQRKFPPVNEAYRDWISAGEQIHLTRFYIDPNPDRFLMNKSNSLRETASQQHESGLIPPLFPIQGNGDWVDALAAVINTKTYDIGAEIATKQKKEMGEALLDYQFSLDKSASEVDAAETYQAIRYPEKAIPHFQKLLSIFAEAQPIPSIDLPTLFVPERINKKTRSNGAWLRYMQSLDLKQEPFPIEYHQDQVRNLLNLLGFRYEAEHLYVNFGQITTGFAAQPQKRPLILDVILSSDYGRVRDSLFGFVNYLVHESGHTLGSSMAVMKTDFPFRCKTGYTELDSFLMTRLFFLPHILRKFYPGLRPDQIQNLNKWGDRYFRTILA